jgi:hypothetical protein
VEAKKMAVLLEKEDAEWKWSPMFCTIRKLLDLPLQYRGRTFAHTAPELQDIISWASEQMLPQFETLPVPGAILPLKRISRAAVGPHVALAWPRNYTKEQQFLEEYKAEFRFAAADVITFGRFYFQVCRYLFLSWRPFVMAWTLLRVTSPT